MRGWVLGCLVVPMVLCVGCVGVGYFAGLPQLQNAVADEVADTLEGKIVRSMSSSEVSRGRIELTEAELDINNDIFSNDVGINVTNNGTEISGFVTQITADEIRVVAGDPDDPDETTYTAIPTVVGGRIELAAVDAGPGRWNIITFFLPEDAFEEGFEDGINRALAARGLRAVDVTLANGEMTIETEQVGESA